jgi:putative ABC transport system permease protein
VTAHPTAPAFKNDLPEIRQAVRIWPTELTVKNWDNHYFEEKIFFADAAIFNTFTFPLLKGSPDTALKAPNTIVITEKMSQKYFNSNDSLGKTLSIKWNDQTMDFKVTGIMKKIPNNSHFKTEFFASYPTLVPLLKNQLNQWLSNSVFTYFLLPQHLPPQELEKKFPALVEKYMGKDVRKFLGPDVDINTLMKFTLRPVSQIHLHSHTQWEIEPNGSMETVYIFSIIAFLVLLIACINFMNLSTARSASRAKEVGLRKTVGANKSLLVKQFIGESLFLALIAGVIAVFLVELLLPMYNAFTAKEMSNRYLTDPLSILAFIVVILFVGIVSGSYPAFHLSSFQPITVMRGTLKTGSGKQTHFLRKGLVVLQFTISIVLIIGTIVVMNQLTFLRNKNLGFQKEQVVVIPAKDNSLLNKYEAIKSELAENPGILAVATSSRIPGDRLFSDRVFLREGMEGDQSKDIIFFQIDTDFIPLLGIELAAGRNFSRDFATDEKEGVILNESAVKLLGWETPEMAIGKGLMVPDSPGKYQKRGIVGVVKDFNFKSLHQKIEPLVLYMDPQQVNYITARIKTGNLPATLAYLEKKFTAFSPGFNFDYFFLDDNFDRLYRSEEKVQTIFNFFTLLAILISCLGLFGLASFTAEQRTREVGIRKVLGATVPNIVRQLSREFITWVLLANILAWPVAFMAMSKWLQNFAYRTSIGVGTFILAGLIALVIALFTVSYQSIKTALANPVQALKYE